MTLEIIKTLLSFRNYMTEGIKDRRFKNGYREKPQPATRIIMNFVVKNPNGYMRPMSILTLGKWGSYMVTEVDNFTGVAKLTVTRVDYLMNQFSLEIPTRLNVLHLGFAVPETQII